MLMRQRRNHERSLLRRYSIRRWSGIIKHFLIRFAALLKSGPRRWSGIGVGNSSIRSIVLRLTLRFCFLLESLQRIEMVEDRQSFGRRQWFPDAKKSAWAGST